MVLVERLFNSSLIAIVNQSTRRKLRICHHKKGSEICTYGYPNTILSVKLNRQRLLVVLEESLYIHNIKDMKVRRYRYTQHCTDCFIRVGPAHNRGHASQSPGYLRSVVQLREELPRVPWQQSDRRGAGVRHCQSQSRYHDPGAQLPPGGPLLHGNSRHTGLCLREGNSHPCVRHSDWTEAARVPQGSEALCLHLLPLFQYRRAVPSCLQQH